MEVAEKSRTLNYEKAVENIRWIIRKYTESNNLKALVLGISGGIDSALCAALARPVCDELGIPLIGRSITIGTNKPDEISRAQAIGEQFCTSFEEVDLGASFRVLAKMTLEGYESADHESHEFKVRLGNAKARIRMIYLYDIAGANKGMVLSTDNYTELMVGFWTLHGDVGDYGMIQNLYKGEVYAMSEYIASTLDNPRPLLDCVAANPTDGLGISNSDLDQLGAKSYDEVDRILQARLTLGRESWTPYIDHPVVKRYESTHFKRDNPYNIPRTELEA